MLQKAFPFSMFVDQKAPLRERKFEEEPRAARVLHSVSLLRQNFLSSTFTGACFDNFDYQKRTIVFAFPVVKWVNGLGSLMTFPADSRASCPGRGKW